MCRDGIPPKNCPAVIILARSSSGAKRKYFQTSAQGLLRNVTLQFHSRGWITIPGFPSKKVEFDSLVLSPPPSPSIGVGMFTTPLNDRGRKVRHGKWKPLANNLSKRFKGVGLTSVSRPFWAICFVLKP